MDDTTTIELAMDGEPSKKMTQYESQDVGARQDVAAMYVANELAEAVGDGDIPEFITLEISEEADVNLELDQVSGKNDDGNYGIYQTPGGSITGLYLSHSTLENLHDGEATPENAPESVGVTITESDEDSWGESGEIDEEEIEGLVGDSDDSDEEEASDDSDEEEEITIEEEAIDIAN